MANISLEVKNLTKLYPSKKGITDISFDIYAGEIVGFIGPNGAGKTTTLKSILKLLIKDSGEINIFNRQLEKNFVDIMQFVGYLPSDEVAYENMTAKAFLNYSNSFYEIDYTENIISLAQRLDLDLNQKINEMSWGNKKKVGIINAVFHEPKLILLDEPTSGLDPLIQLEFNKILKEAQKKGSAILFSSHVLAEVQTICDRVMIIKDGKIVRDTKVEEICNAHKKVYVLSKSPIQKKDFSFDGVKELEIDGLKASFLFVGDITLLIKKINQLEIEDINILNPSLEELFLHYYD